MIDTQELKETNQFILPNLVFKDQKKEHHPSMPVIDEESEDSEDTPRRAIDFEEKQSDHSSSESLYAYDPILLEGQVLWKLTEKNKQLIDYVLEKFIGEQYKFLLN